MTSVFTKSDPAKALQYFADKIAFTTGPVELNRAINQKQDIVVVDVRAAEDFNQGHVGGAVSLPHDKWSNPVGLRKDKLNVVYCYTHVCHLAAAACVELARQGYPVMEMDGGFLAWTKHNRGRTITCLEVSKPGLTARRRHAHLKPQLISTNNDTKYECTGNAGGDIENRIRNTYDQQPLSGRNGLFMLIDPKTWFLIVPGVKFTGGFNQHFIRDIGLIQMFLGIAFVVGIVRSAVRFELWAAATIWLVAHSLFHFWEVATGVCGPSTILRDFPAVTLPAVIGIAATSWTCRIRRVSPTSATGNP